jgi:hypothetical protein
MTTSWRRVDQVLDRRLPDGIMLLHVERGDPVVVTGPGLDVWDALAQPSSVRALAERFAARYDVGVDQIEGDLLPLLEDLEARALVTRSP